MAKTIEEINQKIRNGEAVVITADEAVEMAREKGVEQAAKEVDVVTTGTFGAMCSSGAFINFGHSEPPIKMQRVWLNDIPSYTGLAAVDAYIGATEIKENGEMEYGGAHVIEDLVRGKAVRLRATAYGTDCYPRREIETWISLKDVNQAYLFNPRNAYQNYAVATNSGDRTLYTYMGKLLPHNGNATFCSAGQLSPLLKDPRMRTIGIGTRIFLGGGEGYVAWEGTQFKTNSPVVEGVPVNASRNLAVIGDLRGMNADYLRGLYFHKYGTSLGVGIGVPIPILDEQVMRDAARSDGELFASVLDYAVQSRARKPVKQVSYSQLRSGAIEVNGKEVRTSSLSSYRKAKDIAAKLKEWIEKGDFELTSPVKPLPEQREQKGLEVRSHAEAVR
jgi:uncharacterized protein (DUF39 family)